MESGLGSFCNFYVANLQSGHRRALEATERGEPSSGHLRSVRPWLHPQTSRGSLSLPTGWKLLSLEDIRFLGGLGGQAGSEEEPQVDTYLRHPSALPPPDQPG